MSDVTPSHVLPAEEVLASGWMQLFRERLRLRCRRDNHMLSTASLSPWVAMCFKAGEALGVGAAKQGEKGERGRVTKGRQHFRPGWANRFLSGPLGSL